MSGYVFSPTRLSYFIEIWLFVGIYFYPHWTEINYYGYLFGLSDILEPFMTETYLSYVNYIDSDNRLRLWDISIKFPDNPVPNKHAANLGNINVCGLSSYLLWIMIYWYMILWCRDIMYMISILIYILKTDNVSDMLKIYLWKGHRDYELLFRRLRKSNWSARL